MSKRPHHAAEDMVVATDDFVAVIDGSTSKTDFRHSFWRSNGRQCARIIAGHIRRMSDRTTVDEFLAGVTARVRSHYHEKDLPRLAEHPEDRMTASVVVYSRRYRQIWLVGDCQSLLNGRLYDNPKPSESVIAGKRAAEVRRLLSSGEKTEADLRLDDVARKAVLPELVRSMRLQNVAYPVVDGFPIPCDLVRVIWLDGRKWSVVLASDGYPKLCHTLEESEAALARQLRDDPLNIGQFKATKGMMTGNRSFDDRSYVRFEAPELEINYRLSWDDDHILFGLRGEHVAEQYLVNAGYRIWSRRWKSGKRDIDLVAEDGNTLVFVEVKTRKRARSTLPIEGMDEVKMSNLRKSICHFIGFNRLQDMERRFDFIGIEADKDGTYDLLHIKDYPGVI